MSILNFIKNILKSDSPQQKKTKYEFDLNAYYFHEDDYCQIEYLPKENFSVASKVATEIIQSSEETFDGNGWTGCYIRNEKTIPTKSKKIKAADFAHMLFSEGFSEFTSVTSGYGTAVFPCDNKRAFKKQSIILCIDFSSGIIENIWHDHSPLQRDNDIYKSFLLIMANKHNLLLADWRKPIVIDISNPNEIEKYLVHDE